MRFTLNPATGALTLTGQILLKDASGTPLTGLPNTAIAGGNGSTPYNDEVPVDLFGNVLPLDTLGGDFEGIVVDPNDGSFWMCDEYRPAIYHFTPDGTLIERFVPFGTAAAAGQAPGRYGTEVLPEVIAQRRQNRGFEALAWSDGKLYAWVQSPLRNPASTGNAALNASRSVRVVEFNPVTLATKQYLHVLDNPDLGGTPNTRADKIGDAVALGGGEFLVIERDDDTVFTGTGATVEKKIYRIGLAGATDITSKSGLFNGKSVDQLTLAELAANNIVPLGKALHVDLEAAGYDETEKTEGLVLIDMGTIAVINDNDFGVAGITLNGDGTFIPDPAPEPIQLGLIRLGFNGLDASDRDGLINIRQWPVLGMYQPDSIATFSVGGKPYYIAANEGDAREYIYEDENGDEVVAFAEEARVNSLPLDPEAFPFGAALKNNANLGRLTVTTANGDIDRDGDFDELYVLGGRSFSIYDNTGKRVYDSADLLEQITALADPANFNSTNDENDTFDNRSDNKGP
ncbi:MAG TPA: esterase-like activity of phytase family protein, partial [Verrucomicrobiae bacterium]|nr:esterase-like activity of phytase family protein [Verrucomicrobiae bacterium]